MDLFTTFFTLVFSLGFIGGCYGYNKTLYAAVEKETQLLRELFNGYDKRVRPVMKYDESVQATFGLGLKSLLYLDEQKEYMEMVSYMLMSWHDGRLSWNISQYIGIDLIRVPAQDLWTPDFVPFSSIDEDVHLMDTMAIVYASGHVNWVPTLHLRSPCQVDLKQFPFDKQTCSIKFGSYGHHGDHLNLTYFGGSPENALDTSDYWPNTNWELVDQSCVVNVLRFPCCKEPYPHMEVTLVFKRNPDFYVHMFILPALMLGILVPTTLLIPPEAKERVTLGSILLLSILLLLTKLSDVLPVAHTRLPALTMYYTLLLLWTVLSLMSSTFVLNLYNRGPRRGKVPDSVRWIFLRSLKRLVCLGSDSYYPLSDMDAISMRGLDKSLGGSSSAIQERQSIGGQENRAGSPASSKMERDVDEVNRTLNILSARVSLQDSRQDVLNEWHQVALVVDRVLFFFFLLIFLMCSVILLA